MISQASTLAWLKDLCEFFNTTASGRSRISQEYSLERVYGRFIEFFDSKESRKLEFGIVFTGALL
jgi:hypothetical protein